MDCLCCADGGAGPSSDTEFLGSICKLKSADGIDAKFPAEENRYCLYVVAGCPFAARPWAVLSFYGLTHAIPVIKCFPASYEDGWFLEARSPGECQLVESFPDAVVDNCPLGFHHLSQLYYKASPQFKGAISVPLLWDSEENTAVSNSSMGLSEMLATQMRSMATRNKGIDLYPMDKEMYQQHQELLKVLHDRVTTAVYKINTTKSGHEHDALVDKYYDILEELQERISNRGPYLMGTDFFFCDMVLFISLVRLDLAYQWRFGLGRRNVRENYPILWKYTQNVMDIPGIRETILPRDIMALYFMTLKWIQQNNGRTLPQVPETWEDGCMRGDKSCKRRKENE